MYINTSKLLRLTLHSVAGNMILHSCEGGKIKGINHLTLHYSSLSLYTHTFKYIHNVNSM